MEKSRQGSQFICLSVILINSVFRIGKNYYPRVLLEEYKYVAEEKTIPKYIIDDIEIYFDPDRENFDEEYSNEENCNEKDKEILIG